MSMHIFVESLPPLTKILVQSLQETTPDFLSEFYLSGGTALSLQLGHRESEDLDFFSESSFSPQDIQEELRIFSALEKTVIEKGTLTTFLAGVKLQFLEYPYPLLEHSTNWKGIEISAPLDIACTKLITISQRGSKKDFVDLYFLLDLFPLPELLTKLEEKYPTVGYNQAHILKSLIYFADADAQPMPRMLQPLTWKQVQNRITADVKRVAF